MGVMDSTTRVFMAIGSHATVSVVLTVIRDQDVGQRASVGHSAWNENPPATGWTLVTCMGRSSGVFACETSILGNPTMDPASRGSIATKPMAMLSAVEYLVSVTRAA